MKNLIFIVIAIGLLVVPWQYSAHKERKAKDYVNEIRALHARGENDSALILIRQMPDKHRDKMQLQVASELEETITKSVNQLILDSLNAEKQFLLASKCDNPELLDKLDNERVIYKQTIDSLDRLSAERSARCQCVTVMKNRRGQ